MEWLSWLVLRKGFLFFGVNANNAKFYCNAPSGSGRGRVGAARQSDAIDFVAPGARRKAAAPRCCSCFVSMYFQPS
jgi:hypothetical protein